MTAYLFTVRRRRTITKRNVTSFGFYPLINQFAYDSQIIRYLFFCHVVTITAINIKVNLLDVVVEFFGVAVLAQFGQGLGFYLADALAGDGEFLPYFLEGVALAVLQAES